MNDRSDLAAKYKDQMPKYIDKWLEIGTDTNRVEIEDAKVVIRNLRKLLDLEDNKPIIIVDNPMEAWVMCYLRTEQYISIDRLREEMQEVFEGNPNNYEIPDCELPWMIGSMAASSFAYYDFMIEELGAELDNELWVKYKQWEATARLGCIYPMEDVTILSEKPTVIHLRDQVLHNESGPSLEYDGYGDIKVYSLHGIKVPEWLVMTPASELTIETYNNITSADIKAEFIRKVGIERFIERGAIVDTYSDYDVDTHAWWHKSQYELIDMSSIYSTIAYAPYLKMVNQTTRIYHMEGVSPSCTTIEAALKERFGGKDFIISDIA